MFDFADMGITTNLTLFVIGASLVGFAGTKIAKYADEIARRTGVGEALLGVLLLAGVTSLPEIATSFTAASSGDAPLAVNNLIGSIAMQVAVLAIGDLLYGKRALTSVVPDPVVMLQGALNTVLLSLVAAAVVAGDSAWAGAGLWTWMLLIAAAYSFIKLVEANDRKPWIANREEDFGPTVDPLPADPEASAWLLALKTLGSAMVILLAGYLVASSGEEIAQQSGLGSSFMGVAFVALATSLPEVTTVFAALRRGLHTMAISDILGTNILNVALLFGVDLIDSGDPVLNRVGNFAAFAALLGIVLTGVFLVGLAERRDRTILNMGVDSMAVLLLYVIGLTLLYTMRGSAQ